MKSSLFQIFIIFLSLNLSLNSFQTTLFQQMNKEFMNKNLLISPLSAYQVLSLTTNGARGKTYKEMLSSLAGNNIYELNDINYSILKAAKEFSSIELANAVMTAFIPEERFTDIAYKYEATVEALRDVDHVNYWCKIKTHEKINKILDSIEPNTLMILLNAVYFKGMWTKQFDPQNTKKGYFYNFGEDKNGVQVDMMYIKEKFYYYENEFMQVIEIPFAKDSSSAIVFLPNKDYDINTFIGELDDEKINFYLEHLYFQYEVDLTLPKFELEFSSELNNALQKLGMNDAFNPGKADLTGMRKEGNIYISKVIQKTYLKVDENGAEAAAVTAVVIKTRGIGTKTKRMIVNRPFVMVIKSSELPKNNDILFMAKIEKL